MKSDIILDDDSVEVKGKLNASDGIDTTGIWASSVNLQGVGALTIWEKDSRRQVFQLTDWGTLFIGSDQAPGYLHIRGPEGSSHLSSSRCEAEELVGTQYISAGKAKNSQEGERQGIDGRVSIYNSGSEEAQVELLGKTGDIRMAGSITPTAESPVIYIYEHEKKDSRDEGSSSLTGLDYNNYVSITDYNSQTFGLTQEIQEIQNRGELYSVLSQKSRTIIAYSQNLENTGLIYSPVGHHLTFQNAGEAVLSVNLAKERVGIGTTSPDHALHVNGTVAATNAFQNLSDARCKDVRGEIADALQAVQDLRGVRFRWKADCSTLKTDAREHFGVIAQEVEAILPEVVSEGEDGTKSVAYSEMIPVLIEALKQEVAERRSLEDRMQALETRVKAFFEPVSSPADSPA
jgi:hypothetical protein